MKTVYCVLLYHTGLIVTVFTDQLNHPGNSFCADFFFNMLYMATSSEHYQFFIAIVIFRLFANVGCPSLKAKASLQ